MGSRSAVQVIYTRVRLRPARSDCLHHGGFNSVIWDCYGETSILRCLRKSMVHCAWRWGTESQRIYKAHSAPTKYVNLAFTGGPCPRATTSRVEFRVVVYHLWRFGVSFEGRDIRHGRFLYVVRPRTSDRRHSTGAVMLWISSTSMSPHTAPDIGTGNQVSTSEEVSTTPLGSMISHCSTILSASAVQPTLSVTTNL